MSKPSSTISTPISTPAGTSESKKRYLSSPFSPEDKFVKKNRAYNDSMESLDKSDVSVSLLDPVYEMETVGSAHSHSLPETEIEKIANLLKSSIQEDILTTIKQDLSDIMKTAVSEVKDDRLRKLHDENKRLTQENEELKNRVTRLEQDIDDTEQYNRRNNLRISKFPESASEDTDAIVIKIAETLNVPLTPGDIDRSHRVGRPGSKPQRDIIVKFATYRARERLFINRKKLKDSELKGIYLNEDMTRKRSKFMFEARKQVKAVNRKILGAWSSDGKILVKDLGEKVHRVTSESDFDAIISTQCH